MKNTPRWLMALAIICCIAACPAVRAAEPAKPAPVSLTDNPILPSVDFKGVTLEEAIEFLQSKCPQFKVTILRDLDVPAGFPKVTLSLKGGSLSQVLE